MIKFGNIDNYVTDDSLETDGVELDFGNGIFITVRRAGGSKFRVAPFLTGDGSKTSVLRLAAKGPGSHVGFPCFP